jgi:DNA-binding NarL/FixJ family response regulator
MTRILLVDDHPLVRQGARAALSADADLEVVGEARDGNEAMSLTRGLRPDVILLDIRLPGKNGIDVARALRRELPETKVIILTSYNLDAYVRACFAIGVDGYLLKTATDAELVDAVRAVLRGEQVVSAEIPMDTAEPSGQANPPALSERECEVLQLVALGETNRAIGLRLGLKESTIESYLGNAFGKLGARSRSDAANRAMQLGLIVPPD